jgi:hypothetical protein
MALKAPNIRLDIERIVVDGLPLSDRDHFVRAFKAECAAGLADAQFDSAALARGRIEIAVPLDAGAEALGRALAREIVRLVRRP